jgi:hypothetical protein
MFSNLAHLKNMGLFEAKFSHFRACGIVNFSARKK